MGETAQFDIGFDLGLFNNRITLDASYYNKKTSDLLLDAPVPHTTGFETVYKNIGSIRNQGLDLMLSTRNIDTKDFLGQPLSMPTLIRIRSYH